MSTWRTYACVATEVNKMHLDIIRIWCEPLNRGRLPCCGSRCQLLVPAIGQKVQDGLSLVQERYVVWVERIYNLRGHMAPSIAPVPRYYNSWGGSGSGGGRGGSGSGSGSGLYGAMAAVAAMAAMAAIAAAEAVLVASTAASSRQD